jgi:peptidoglycan hydrolase-like protein with peptidoglycan-binding domain
MMGTTMNRRIAALVAVPLIAVAALVTAVLFAPSGAPETASGSVLAVGERLDAAVAERPGGERAGVGTRVTTQTQALRPHLALGDSGDDITLLQERLHEAGYDPGPVDGHFRMPLQHAVWAFQKVHGRAPTGIVTLETWRDLSSPVSPPPLVEDGAPTRVEVDLGRQLLILYEDGERTLITHASTGTGKPFCTDRGGCRYADTPAGDFKFTWRVDGWRESDLGLLYNPVYFHGGIAIHGSYHVPTEPSSYGCVRIPMHIADYFPERVSRDDPVHVRG